MAERRKFNDRNRTDYYKETRGILNRRVEISVIDAGACGIMIDL